MTSPYLNPEIHFPRPIIFDVHSWERTNVPWKRWWNWKTNYFAFPFWHGPFPGDFVHVCFKDICPSFLFFCWSIFRGARWWRTATSPRKMREAPVMSQRIGTCDSKYSKKSAYLLGCLRWFFTDSTMVNHHGKTPFGVYFFFPTTFSKSKFHGGFYQFWGGFFLVHSRFTRTDSFGVVFLHVH